MSLRRRPKGEGRRAAGQGGPAARLRRELRDFVELWGLPLAVALLPYAAGIALAARIARCLPVYDAAAQAGLAQYRGVCGGDGQAWLAEYRFAQLIDHADLFWALTRSRRFLHSRMDAPDMPGTGPLLVLSMHFGQGLWLLSWLRHHGAPARFLSIRFAADAFASTTHYLYARLRMAMVERLAGAPPIYTGGARREIVATLRRGGVVYGLIDVPTAGSAANATLFGVPIHWPSGLSDCARGEAVDLLLLTASCERNGRRRVEACRTAPPDVRAIAACFEQRIRARPGAWHFWHLFAAQMA
jgi:hypothetical protein